MRRHGEYWYVALVFLPAAILGCTEELGPEHFVTTKLSGRLLVGGQPVREGWVEFLPIEGTVGKPRSAPIRPDGRFEADRVAVGWNRIGVVGATLSPEFTGMFHPFGSPIRRKITSHPAPLVIDLWTEAIESRQTRSRGFQDSNRPDPPR